MASFSDSFTENTFGDLSYSFLEPVPNYLTCIICYGLLKDAVATECCGKMFCYEHSSSTAQVCPACRHTPLSVTRNKGIDSIVKDLKVFCLNHREGCQWSGHLCFEPNHRVVTCGHESVPCEKECGVSVQRRFMRDHLTEECLLREVDCEFCAYRGTAAEVASHLEICPEYLIACPHGCELQLPRKGLNNHSSTCLEAPVSCPFASAGCNTMPVKRKDLAGHLETSVVAHLLLLASCNQCLTEEVIELRKEKEELLERSRVEAANLEKVKTELHQVKTELHQVTTELHQVKDKVDGMIQNARSNDVEGVRRQLVVSNECVAVSVPDHRLFTSLYDDMSNDDTSNDRTSNDSTSSDDRSYDGTSNSDEDEFWHGREINAGRRGRDRSWVEDIYDPRVSDITHWGFPLVVKYENVADDMTTNSTWTSPPFCDDQGYCMCLCVSPNGIKQALGSFVSVQMQMQVGDNDRWLPWPYNKELEVEILNPRANHRHCMKTMDFSSFPQYCVCQPDGYSVNEPWGILRFLSHDRLHHYLWNDTLYFRVMH